MSNNGWIGVDLDGTLAHYDGWKGIAHIGAPIAPMVARVKRWLAEGRAVKVFTARVDGGEVALAMGDQNGVAHRDIALVRQHIGQWCLEHIGVVLPITNVKDYGMIELWDDRAVQVIPNTGEPVGKSTRGLDDPKPVCAECGGAGTIEVAESSTNYQDRPCPVCRPLMAKVRAPVDAPAPGQVPTDAGLAESLIHRARFLRDNPGVTESHEACRKLICELLQVLEEDRG